MKKSIILLFFVFMCSFVMAQEAPDTVQTDFKHVVYKDVKDVIKSLAEALKVGTEHVYGVLVKQQVVNSIVYLIIIVVAITMFTFSYHQFMKIKFDSYGDIGKGTGVHLAYGLVIGIPGLIMLGIGLASINIIVTGFVNPEYGAIEKIIEMLK